MSCCIAIGFFELPGLAGGFLYTKNPPPMDSGAARRCVMKQLFERVSSYWVRYDKYVIRTDAKGTKYVTAAEGARPQIIDPLEDAQAMVLDALNAGRLFFGKKAPE